MGIARFAILSVPLGRRSLRKRDAPWGGEELMMLPDNFDELALIGPPATPRQVKYAKKLALDCGRSIVVPQSKVQAETLIDCLLEERDSLWDRRDSSWEEDRENRQREEWGVRSEVAVGVYATVGWD